MFGVMTSSPPEVGSKIITQAMSQVMSNNDLLNLSDSNSNKLIISSMNMRSLNYKGDGIVDIRRFPPKKRQIMYDGLADFERPYIQKISIPAVKLDDNDGGHDDDNFHFLMSLLPSLREVPKNRKMAIRHKLQKVFVDEQERKTKVKNTANGANSKSFSTSFPTPGAVQHQNPVQHQTMQLPMIPPRLPPPPYPLSYKFNGNNYVSAAMAMPLQNATATSTSTSFGDLHVQQPNLQDCAPNDLQQLQHNVLQQSGLQQSGLYQSGLQQSGLQQSGLQQSGLYQSGLQQSGLQQSGLQQSGLQQSGLQQSGLQQSGLQQSGLQESGQQPQFYSDVTNANNSYFGNDTAANNNFNFTSYIQSADTEEPQTITYLQ